MPDFQRLPLFPLNTVLFPGLTLPLRIFEPRYLVMLRHCVDRRAPFGVVLIRDGMETGSGPIELAAVGTTARITKCERSDDGSYFIEVEGETRFIIDETFDTEPYLTASVTPFWEQTAEPLDLQPLYDQTVTLFKDYIAARLAAEQRYLASLQMPQDPVLMSFAVAASLETALSVKQTLLEIAATSERLLGEIDLLRQACVDDVPTISHDEQIVIQTFVPLEATDVLEKLSRN